MVFAAKKTGLAFILNVVLNNQKEIVAAFAGDMEKAHQAGTGFLASLCQCAPVISDIVITSNGGYPLDQNIYQSVKCMTTAAKTCRPGGVIIAVCQCRDGHGGDSFFETFASEPDTRLIMEQIQNRNSTDTVPDQWQSQIFCRILLNYHVILVSDAPKSIVEHLHLTYATGIDEAIVLAKAMIQTERPSITVIPDGLSVMF